MIQGKHNAILIAGSEGLAQEDQRILVAIAGQDVVAGITWLWSN
jgi:hypothetical protein